MKGFNVINELGFCKYQDLFDSLFRPEQAFVLLPISTILSMLEFAFGLKPIVLLAFVILLTLELFSGIMASLLEGKRIYSRRLRSFGVMLVIWLGALFIINMFRYQFVEEPIHYVFDYLFVLIIIYANLVYFTSIWENAVRINRNKRTMSKQLSKFSKVFSSKLTDNTK